MTRNARIIILGISVLLLGWTFYWRAYDVSAAVVLGIGLLIWSHYRHGTVMLAAQAFHYKDYDKAEKLLDEIEDPDRLSRKRRGFYEFIYGNIELHRSNYEDAERHFQIASRFPLRNENDKGIVLVQLANLSLRKKEYSKAKAYTKAAKALKISARVKHIVQTIENEIKTNT